MVLRQTEPAIPISLPAVPASAAGPAHHFHSRRVRDQVDLGAWSSGCEFEDGPERVPGRVDVLVYRIRRPCRLGGI